MRSYIKQTFESYQEFDIPGSKQKKKYIQLWGFSTERLNL